MRSRLWVLTHFRITVKTCDFNLRNYIFLPNTEAQLTLNRNNWIRASKMPRRTRFGLIKFYFIWCVIFYKGKNRCTASIHSMKDCNCPVKYQPVRSQALNFTLLRFHSHLGLNENPARLLPAFAIIDNNRSCFFC